MRSPRSKNKVPKTSLLCKSQPQMTFSEITHDCSRNSKTLAFSEGKAVPSQVHMLIPRLDYGSDHQARHSFFYNQFVAQMAFFFFQSNFGKSDFFPSVELQASSKRKCSFWLYQHSPHCAAAPGTALQHMTQSGTRIFQVAHLGHLSCPGWGLEERDCSLNVHLCKQNQTLLGQPGTWNSVRSL